MKLLVLFVLGILLACVSCKNFPISSHYLENKKQLDSLEEAEADSAFYADSVAHADSSAKMATK